MPEIPRVFDWALERDGDLFLYKFDQSAGTLQRNGELVRYDQPTSLVLGVLLQHADAPVTTADFLEAGLQTKGGGAVKKIMSSLTSDEFVGGNVLQIGENKRAVMTFLTNPDDPRLFYERLGYMYAELQTDEEANIAQRHKETLKKAGIITSAIAASAAGYIVVRQVYKRR